MTINETPSVQEPPEEATGAAEPDIATSTEVHVVSAEVPEPRLSQDTSASFSRLTMQDGENGDAAEDDPPERGQSFMLKSRMPTSVTAVGAQVQFAYLHKTKLLGAGSFGSVFEGSYFEQSVAIKYLTFQELSEEALEEFSHEADLHFHLRHRNIVELLCYNTDPEIGEICMVMQKLDCSLHDILHESDEDLMFSARIDMIEDMARGLMYLHSLGIVHLDLKSMNMLLDRKRCIKICDFGLSRVKEEVKRDEDDSAAGSLPWMAPELMLGEKPTLKADVFSFYVIMWEVMARKRPHDKKKVTQIIKAVSRQQKRLEMPENMPEQLEELFQRCWDPSPDARPSMEEVVTCVVEIRKNPRLRVTTSAALGECAQFNYTLKKKSLRLTVFEEPVAGAAVVEGVVITGDAIFSVEEHLVVANLLNGQHDQLFLKLATGGWVHAFDPETGDLLVEQSMSVIGPQALLTDANKSGLRQLCTAFRTHIANKEVAYLACRMIAEHATSPQALENLHGAGGINTVVRALLCYPDKENIVYMGLAAIMHLASEQNCALMIDAGIVQCLLSALQNCRANADVQYVALGAIMNITGASAPSANVHEVLHEVCPHIMGTLTQHQDQDRIQQFGYGCVAYLSNHHPGNQASFTETGACEAVVATLRQSEESRAVCEMCCLAITHLARNHQANQDTFCEAGACEMVVRTVNRFSPNEVIINRGIGAIMSLSSKHPGCCERLGAADACRVVVAALNLAEGNLALGQQCLGALQQLIMSLEANRDRFVAAGVCPAIITTIANNAANLEFQRLVLAVFMNLTFTQSFAESLARVDNWTGFLEPMRLHPLDVKIQEVGCGLVSNLSHHFAENCKVLGDNEACDRVMVALANHTRNARIVEYSFRAIYNLSNPRQQSEGQVDETSEQNLSRLRSLNARGTIQTAMDTHKKVASLQQWGNQCLRLL